MLAAASMQSSLVVLETVLAVLAVMAVGALLRRRGVLTDASSAAMSRVVADVAFPALCLEGLVQAEPETLRSGAVIAALGFVTLALAALVGLALVRALGVPDAARPTAVFAIAIGNWIFLPLPVAEALYGASGTTTVILHNVGAQLFLWTVGLVILRRGKLDGGAARAIVASPGLWATLAGITLALAAPDLPALGRGLGAVLAVARDALHYLASLTIPLVSIAIGAQLASPVEGREPAGRALGAVLLGRMLLAPLVVGLAIELAARVGALTLPTEARMTEHLIAAMPVSLSAAALVQRYEGDVPLVSRAILVTTLLAVVTAPLWMFGVSALAS